MEHSSAVLREDVSSVVRRGLLRTLAFHETWGHAPTQIEWLMTAEIDQFCETSSVYCEMNALVEEGVVIFRYGRYAFPSGETMIAQIRQDELWTARKYRVARQVVSWLVRLKAVRFVALCNTTALGHARDTSDLDFFVITHAGALMQTRGLAAAPFKLLNRRPGATDERDAVCLSYLISDEGLDLSSHMLTPDDPYFRYWFLSLLPLYDDGISTELWRANPQITARHPFSRPWSISPDLEVRAPWVRAPAFSVIEQWAVKAQMYLFPDSIRALMNQDARVIITDRALKFHVDDGREMYRQRFEEDCQARGIV